MRARPDWIHGCGDHGCVIEKPKGQATNGGCHCSGEKLRNLVRWFDQMDHRREKNEMSKKAKFEAFHGPLIMRGNARSIWELLDQIRLLVEIDGGLAQPDHSESEEDAAKRKAVRAEWQKKRDRLAKSIKTALIL